MNIARSTLINTLKSTSNTRNYAFKSDLKIKWLRPEKIPCYKPEKSGDLASVPPIDKSEIQLQFRNSKELETADDLVRKIFSLEFAPKRKTNQLYFHQIISGVKRHNYDISTVEVKIAKWTGVIRVFQEIMKRFPRNKVLKVQLKELIDKRKKQLKYLRRWDYKRFEWLLDALDIVYKSPPDHFHWITRKESLVKLTNIHCDGIKNERLEQYRTLLESQQPGFLEEKIRTLEFIQEEQKSCGVEVTVTAEEIEALKVQLSELVASRKAVDND